MRSAHRVSSSHRRLFAVLLGAIALCSTPRPAGAVVDPPRGKWIFTLYRDASGIGSGGYVANIEPVNVNLADLRPSAINDAMSSWSFCNGLAVPVYVTVSLYVDIYYTGAADVPVVHQEVQPGLCIIQNHVWIDDAVSSIKLMVEGQ